MSSCLGPRAERIGRGTDLDEASCLRTLRTRPALSRDECESWDATKGGRRSGQTEPDRGCRRFGAVGDTKLGQDVGDVSGDGAAADEEGVGDLLVGEPRGY